MSAAGKAHVARLYFVRDLTKQEIARRLGISRFKVARLLDEARTEGIVRFEIDEPVPYSDPLAEELERAYGLDLAVVVPDEASIARAGAGLLPELVGPNDVLGVAWGRTLRRLADELEPLDTATPVVQVCGAVAGLEPGAGPTETALRFAERTGGTFHPLPAPALASRRARDELLAHDAVRPTVELFDAVTLALVGIGAHPRGGHVLVHVFDEEGRFVEEELSIALSLERLRAARVVALAGGEAKRAAVTGALRTGLLNVLVTDDACARYAVR
jgi:DNA-binding transcriptional regulator LsrR (DeoR family)